VGELVGQDRLKIRELLWRHDDDGAAPRVPPAACNVIARYVLIRQVIIKDAVVLALARRQYDPVPVFEIAEEGGDVVVGAFAPGPTRSGP